MTDHLFDPTPYGDEPEPRRRQRAEPGEIKVRPPWVVLTSAERRPVAHVLDLKRTATREGSRFAVCGAAGRVLTLDGEPVAPACAACRRRSEST